MRTMTSRVALPLAALLAIPAFGYSQAPAAASPAQGQTAAPRQSGTVKAVTPTDFVLTSAAGQDYAVTLGSATKILLVDPATRDVKNAQAGTAADIAGGDKVIVTGTVGDAGQTLTATRVYLLKSAAITALHEQEQAAWAHSVGGIVKAVDAGTGAITVANGARTYTVNTTPTTVVRRYANGSVRFEDAVKSSVSAIQPGDQVQARGQHAADSTTVAADEIVTGSFSNFSGTLTEIDTAAGTVTLKDLATKKLVTVAITGQTNLRKLPAGFEAGAGQGAGGRQAAEGGQPAASAQVPAASPATAGGAAGNGRAAGTAAGRGAARLDLSRIMSRLPTETTGDLKRGDAVMIVASNSSGSGSPTAITLLSGVEQILAASPAGQTTLSPWSLGGGESEGGEASGGAAASSGPGAR